MVAIANCSGRTRRYMAAGAGILVAYVAVISAAAAKPFKVEPEKLFLRGPSGITAGVGPEPEKAPGYYLEYKEYEFRRGVATPTPAPTPSLPPATKGGVLFQSVDCPALGCLNGVRLEVFDQDHPVSSPWNGAGSEPLASIMLGNYHYSFDAKTGKWYGQWGYGNTAWDTCSYEHLCQPGDTGTTNGYNPRFNELKLLDKDGSLLVKSERGDQFKISVVKDPEGIRPTYLSVDVATASF